MSLRSDLSRLLEIIVYGSLSNTRDDSSKRSRLIARYSRFIYDYPRQSLATQLITALARSESFDIYVYEGTCRFTARMGSRTPIEISREAGGTNHATT